MGRALCVSLVMRALRRSRRVLQECKEGTKVSVSRPFLPSSYHLASEIFISSLHGVLASTRSISTITNARVAILFYCSAHHRSRDWKPCLLRQQRPIVRGCQSPGCMYTCTLVTLSSSTRPGTLRSFRHVLLSGLVFSDCSAVFHHIGRRHFDDFGFEGTLLSPRLQPSPSF